MDPVFRGGEGDSEAAWVCSGKSRRASKQLLGEFVTDVELHVLSLQRQPSRITAQEDPGRVLRRARVREEPRVSGLRGERARHS